jgi:hypothetical protein
MNSLIRQSIKYIVLTGLVVGLMHPVFGAEVQDHYSVLKISSQEHTAVMRVNGEEARLVRIGDAVGKRGKVTEIAEGRVVIEEGTGKDAETVIIRLENDKQKVERIRRTGDRKPLFLAPAVMMDKRK